MGKVPKRQGKKKAADEVTKATEAIMVPVEPEVVLPGEDDSEISTDELETELGTEDGLVVDVEAESFPESEDVRSEGEPPPVTSSAVVPYNPLDAYLAEIRRFAPLGREEEHKVALSYHKTKSPEAAYKLVSSNLWLVVKIARDYERVARNLLDLIQEGNIGLMEAVKNFDPYRGVRFPSYAVWWIRAYIIRFIIANWRMVKIGTTQAQRKLFFNLKKESERLEREGIYPSARLLAERLNVREGDIVEMTQRLSGPDMSVDSPLQDDSDTTLLSLLPNEVESAEDLVAKRQFHQVFAESVDAFKETLSDREKLIFQGRVLDDEKVTLQELSDQLTLSKERVRQIENRLREKLKVFVTSRMGSDLSDWVDVE